MSKPIVAIVGRPNVGKSTLFNQIGKKRISIVDDMPGVTRDRIYLDAVWLGKPFVMIDTGGIEFSGDDKILSSMRDQAKLAMDEADVIILASPVYVYHATGAMKAFLDHLGYRWMVHRPEEKMFKKQGVCISTAAGAGMKSTNKDMADSLFNWGIPKIYKYGMAVAATGWEEVSEKKLAKIHKDMDRLAADIKNNHGKVKPGMKLKGWFMICRMIQKNGYNPLDMDYWKQKGWTEGNRPWKD